MKNLLVALLISGFMLACASNSINRAIVDTSKFKLVDRDMIDYSKMPKNSGNTDEQGYSIEKVEFYIDARTKHIWIVSYYEDDRMLLRDLSKDLKVK
jgi:hypothetical protein